MIIHHIDEDFTNNDPLNLRAVTWTEHMRIHKGKSKSVIS
jgi:hypothetical protein